jgi:hypothetical protein
LTDFGLSDGFVGIMKGVIWTIAPDVHIADISHHIKPQDIFEGAYILGKCTPYFPAGSVHVAVIDPGVGTDRRPIAARLGESFFVGPDNGLITYLLSRCERQQETLQVVHLDRPHLWLTQVSRSFHGRDIFAPVAAHLVRGMPLTDLGTPIDDPLRLEIPQPLPLDRGWRGQIVHIDHFGNLETNLGRNHMLTFENAHIRFGDRIINGLSKTFGDCKPGQLLAYIDSSEHLSISEVNGSAEQRLNARVGDDVEVTAPPKTIIEVIRQ